MLLLLLLGGFFGLVVVVVSALAMAGRDASTPLVEEDPVAREEADVHLHVTVTDVDAEAGELTARVLPTPSAGWAEGGLLTQGLRIFVNDIRGEATHTFRAGAPLQAVDVTVGLTGGSAFQYPFDRYETTVLAFAAEGTEPEETEPLTLSTSASSTLSSFHLEVSDTEACGSFEGTCLPLDVRRPMSTIGYGIWFMVLIWALAVAGLGVLWIVVRRGVELPLWAFGYLVGVLFALPPLRASLPGNPPAGGFVDFAAFFWVIAAVASSLIVLIWLWIRENRRVP